jgi:hypothetical protein
VADKRDQFVAEVSFQADRMEAGVKRASQLLESFDTTSSRAFENFARVAEDSMKKASKPRGRPSTSRSSLSNKLTPWLKLQQKISQQGDIDLAGQFADIGSRGKEIVGAMLGASSQVDQFRLTLVTLTGSAEAADKELARLQKYAGDTQFDLQGGAIALDTKDDLKKLADAIEEVAKKKNFVGAVNAQLGTLKANASQASDAAFNLAAAIGQQVTPVFIPLAQATTNALTALAGLPNPILAIVGLATAMTTGLALAGGAALAFNTAMGAAVPILSSVVPALTGIQVASAGAASGATAAAVAFNPFLVGVTALALAGGGALLVLNSFEQSAKKAGDEIKRESQEIGEANLGFLEMRDAIAEATGASEDFVARGASVADTAAKVKAALAGTSSADFLASLEKGGDSFEDLGEKAKNAEADLAKLQRQRQAAQAGLAVLQGGTTDSFGHVRPEVPKDEAVNASKALQQEFGSASFTVGELLDKIAHLDQTMAKVRQTTEGAIAPSIEKASIAYNSFTDAANRAAKAAADFKINGETDNLERNNQLLEKAKKDVADLKTLVTKGTEGHLDVGSVPALQDKLTSGKASKEEVTAITGLLDALERRNKLEQQGADIVSKAAKARVEAKLEGIRDLNGPHQRISALEQLLAAEGKVPEVRKAIEADLRREMKTLQGEERQAHNERVQQDIFEASNFEGTSQQKIAALQRVIDMHKLEGAEQRRVLKEIDSLKDDIAKKEEARRKAEADGLSSENQRQQELVIAALDERIAKLQEEAAAGKHVQDELLQAIQDRTDKEVALIQERSDARKKEADSDKVASEIEETGALEVAAARRQGIDAIEDTKKAQDDRIQKIKDERKEALKAVKDEKTARNDLNKTIRSQSSSQQQDAAPAGPAQPSWVNPFPNWPFSAPPGRSQGLSFPTLNFGIPKDVQDRVDEIRANRGAKEEERHQAFIDANPELWQQMLDEDAKRRDELSKKDAERQEAARKTADADRAADAAKRAEAQVAVDNARRSDAIDRSAVAGVRRHTPEEIAKQFELSTPPNFDLSKFSSLGRPKTLSVTDPLQATIDKMKAAGKAVPGQPAGPKAPAAQGVNGTLSIEMEIKGAQVASAKVKAKTADLDGKVSDLMRLGQKMSFRVNT